MKNGVSVFERAKNPVPKGETPWQSVVDSIKSGAFKNEVLAAQKILKEQGVEEYRKVKQQFLAVTFPGTFKKRRAKENFNQATGFIIADVDHVDPGPLCRLLEQDKNIWFSFRSPSGEGVKAAIRAKHIDSDVPHKQLYYSVERYFKEKYRVEIDPACKDVSRLTFVSWDPEAFINDKPIYFDVDKWSPQAAPPPQTTPQPIPISTGNGCRQKYGAKVLESACQEIMASQPTQQHVPRVAKANLVGGFIATGYIDESEALAALEAAVRASGAKNMKASMKDIYDGIAFGKTRPLDPIADNPGPQTPEPTKQLTQPQEPAQQPADEPPEKRPPILPEVERRFIIQAKLDGQDGKLTIRDAVLSAAYFAGLQIQEREYMLKPWLPTDAFGYVNGWRGIGKSWFALGVADAVSSGSAFGPWECESPGPVLYLDGEMALTENMERIIGGSLDNERENPLYILSDALLNRLGLPKCHLADITFQKEIKALLLDLGVKLFIADNIASLTPGLTENSKEEWDPINQFFIDLRFAGISTIAVHHLGKSGDQRGTSGREDNANFSLKLLKPPNYHPEDGCRFVTNLSKGRIHSKYLNLIADTEFKLSLTDDERQVWTHSTVKQSNKIKVLECIKDGFAQKDIANQLGVTKGTVSKIINKAIDNGNIHKKRDGKLTLTQSGEVLLCGV